MYIHINKVHNLLYTKPVVLKLLTLGTTSKKHLALQVPPLCPEVGSNEIHLLKYLFEKIYF